MPSAVSAQTDVPPVYPSTDDNGVDLATGRINIALADISIGPGGPGSLSYSYTTSNGSQGITGGAITFSTSPNKAIVRIGPRTTTFTIVSTTTFTNDQGGGATLTYDAGAQLFTFTGEDGSVAIFSGTLAGPAALLDTLTYPSGERLTFPRGTVYGATRLLSVSSNLGYQLRYIYATSGAISSVVLFNMANEACDPAATTCSLTGSWPSFTFTGTATDSLGRVSQIQYVSATQTIVTYASGRTLTYTINAANDRVTAVSDGTNTWTYSYSLALGVSSTTVTAPGGASVRKAFWNSTTGAITAITVGDGVSQNRTTAFVRDSQGRVANYASPDGGYTVYTYDARGNVTEQRRVSATPGTPADIVITASYPATCTNPVTCNKPDYVIDARGNRTDYTYDPVHGGVLTVRLPAGPNGIRPETRYTYTQVQATYLNGSGTPILGTPVWRVTAISRCATLASCTNTADEVRTTISYGTNAALQPVSTTNAAGDNSLSATTTTTYTPVGDVRTVDGPLAGTADTTRFYYDGGRQRIGTIGPDPDGGGALLYRAERMTFNNDGQVTLAEIGTATGQGDTAMTSFVSLIQAATAYDAQGHRSRQSISAGGTTSNVTQYSYTATGLIDCVAQRMNPAVFGSLPASACDLSTTGTAGPDRIVRTTYNHWFEPTQVTTAYGTSLQGVESAMTYTAQGLETLTDGNGNRTTYVYDGFSQRTRIRYPSPTTPGTSSTTDYENFTYDAAGNVTLVTTRDGTSIALSYDNLNRLMGRDLPNGLWYNHDIAYTHDNFGRLLTADNGNTLFHFAYDALGRRSYEYNFLGPVSYQYDAAGRRTRMTWPDGFYVTYDRLVTGEVTAIRENGAASGVGVLGTYAYDDLGRRTSLTRGNGTSVSYGYDGISRLTGLTDDLSGTTYDQTIGLTYNAASQIVSTTRSNDAYAWTGHYAVNRAYTANGLNQYTLSGSVTPTYDTTGNLTSAGTTTYTYNAENRLAVRVNGGIWQGLVDDSLDRLSWYYDGAAQRWFLYDGQQMIMETNSSGTGIARRYVFGPGGDEPLVWYEGSGTTDRRWLHADERGSIVAISNGSGSVTNVNSYDEYGIPGASNTGRFQYTGQAWLPELGMSYHRARIYSPTLGRFMQTDPIGYAGGINLYAYVRNDPVNLIDPLGLQCEEAMASQGSHTSGCFDSDNDVVVTGNRPWSPFTSPIFEQVRPLEPAPGGPGQALSFAATGNGRSASGAGRPAREDPGCRHMQEAADRNRNITPWISANWENPGVLRGYLNLYQSNADELRAFDSPIRSYLLGFIGPGWALAWGGEMFNQSQARADAIRARLEYLRVCQGR